MSRVGWSWVLIVGLTGLAACGGDDRVAGPADTIPPAPPGSPAATPLSPSSVELTWTAPGDDNNQGTAAVYELRYSTSAITESTFVSAISVVQVPAPSAPGTEETVTITDLQPNTAYHFAIRAADEASNRSDLAFAAATTPGLPATDENWSDVFAGNSLNGIANAFTIFEDALVVGGQFTTAGGTNARYAVRWTGTEWLPFGADPDGVVRALAVYDGNLIAGGEFGGTESTVGNLLRWDGSTWSSMGAGLNNVVRALTLWNGDLIAGGLFKATGDSVLVNHVARWDGAQWTAMGEGVSSSVYALLVHEEQLYAGGLSGVSRWNGTSWETIGEGVVSALGEFEGDLIAGGEFTAIGDNVARWNGAGWTGLGAGLNKMVSALAVYNDELIAGGGFTMSAQDSTSRVARWNGATWEPLGSGVNRPVNALTVFEDALYVGGSFTLAGGRDSRGVARWKE